MNKVLDTIEEAANLIERGRDNLNKVIDESAGNSFKYSQKALNLIGNKYDKSSSPDYDITNPVTGANDYTVEARTNFKNYISIESKMNMLYLQKEVFKQVLYNVLTLLSDGLNSKIMTSIVENSKDDLEQVRDYIRDAEEYKETAYDYTNTALDYWNIVRIILQVVYYLTIISSIIAIVVIILRAFFGKLRYILKIFWVVLIILAIVTILLTAISLPVAVFVAESSDVLVYEDIIYNRDVIREPLWDTISVCLVGDGNLDSVYSVTDDLVYMKELIETVAVMDEIYIDGELRYRLNEEYVKNVSFLFYP